MTDVDTTTRNTIAEQEQKAIDDRPTIIVGDYTQVMTRSITECSAILRDIRARQTRDRKIAIIGKATSSMLLAPYEDPTWEIWGLSDCWRYVPRLDRSFEIHDYNTGCHRWKKEYTDWMKANQDKLVIHAAHPDLPDATPFPWIEILSHFRAYFTNSVSWMIALAMKEGCTHLALFGVDMAQSDPGKGSNGEYETQRPSCEYYIGYGDGIGIDIHIPPQSDLLKPGQLYALESHKGSRYLWQQSRYQELSTRQNALVATKRRLQRELDEAEQNIARMQGAMESDAYTFRARPGG